MTRIAKKHYARNQFGQAITFLMTLTSVTVIGTTGLVAFEIGRYMVCRDQLRTATDAAALAAVATLAGSDFLNPKEAHNNAMSAAKKILAKNDILSKTLELPDSDQKEALSTGHTALEFKFKDPQNNLAEVAIGDPKGKVVEVSAKYGYAPHFAAFLGLSKLSFPISVTSSGGVPDLDLVLCFDISASIDDQTKVSFVKRYLSGKNQYEVKVAKTIFSAVKPAPGGSSVNAYTPQGLEGASSSGYGFSAELRGDPSAGSPPPTDPDGSSTFTDLVVNLDEKDTFEGITIDNYAFPNIASLVEASRGNLDSPSAFVSSGASTILSPLGIAPKAGYKEKYFQAAYSHLHPLKEAQDAAAQFIDVMNTNTQAHFGLVSFNHVVNANDTAWSISKEYPAGGKQDLKIPLLALSKDATQYQDAKTTINQLVATGGTNIGWALNEAVEQLKKNSREDAKRAIVLFTDGEPTAGKPLSDDFKENARMAAAKAKKEGIPIFTIGLAQVPEIIANETDILNDSNSDPTTGGIAAIAGNGGKFFLVTDPAKLRYTFENVARHLTQLVR